MIQELTDHSLVTRQSLSRNLEKPYSQGADPSLGVEGGWSCTAVLGAGLQVSDTCFTV